MQGKIQRFWSMNRLKRYIIQLYPNVPLEDTGFHFGKFGRDKKIEVLLTPQSISELENSIGRCVLLIIPNRDLQLQPYRGNSPIQISPESSWPTNPDISHQNFPASPGPSYHSFPVSPGPSQHSQRYEISDDEISDAQLVGDSNGINFFSHKRDEG